MPNATITSTASTFGTISGTFADSGAIVTGTISGIITGTLDGSVGVPGIGVPAGGSTGQVLKKSSGSDYATEWATDTNTGVWGQISGSLSAQTDLSTALAGKYSTSNPDGYLNQTSGYNYFTNYFYPLTGNPGGYATQAWVTGQNYITISALSPYVLQTQLNYQLAGYALQSWVTDRFYPLTGNPSGFLTTASLSGYATESWVTAQSYLTTSAAASTYAVTARGLPSSGTAGQVLTKVNGTDYNANWVTLIPGDRYLTTSTTSLTVGNGTKSLTVGTGLSYSPQQDVTIAYDGTAHMHAVVTSYNSTTGAMVVDVQNHSGSGTYADWTVNVGGTVPLASIAWGDITGTLGDQSDLATALNAKLDTTTAASTYYPLTGNPSSFLVASDLTGYALESWVNSQGFLTSSSLSGYATESWVNSQGFTKTDTAAYFSSVIAEDSPGSSNYRGALSPFYLQFVYGTGPDRSVKYGIDGIQFEDGTTLNSTNGLATQSWVTAQSYLTSSALYGYATESWVSAGFYPLTGNPSSFLVSADLAGYATESWVSSQGYITSAALSGLTDVTLTYPANGEVLKYDSATSKWINGTITSSVAWGSITGTLSSQTDLSTALSAKLDSTTAASTYYLQTNPSGYITSSALSGYLTSATAASTYQTISGMSSYLTTASASSTYYLQSNPSGYITSSALSGYLTSATAASTYSPLASPTFTGTVTIPAGASISGYLTSATAASTYQTITGMSSYLTTADASTTYQTQAGMSSYLTTSTASSTYLTQTNAASTYQTISGMSSYLTTSTASSTYQTQAGMSSYLTTSSAASTYAPLASPTFTGTVTIPAGASISGYLTSATAASTYQTQAGMSSYLTTSTAASTYAPLASPTLTGTPLSTTAAADTNTTQIATTAFVVGQASSTTPAANGTAAVGTSLKYARADHVHASDNNIKAWVNFNGVPLTGTYSQSGTTITVTMTAHGMSTGQVVNLDFTSGTATDGTYTVTVTGANAFTVTSATSTMTSGNVTRQVYIRASLNVSSITDNGVGNYTVNLTNATTDSNGAISGNSVSPGVNYGLMSAYPLTTTSIGVSTFSTTAPNTLADNTQNSVVLTR